MHEAGDRGLDREAGRLVYPVVSRRSGGLSLGLNLFPDAKVCSFDCPYCEVFTPPGPSAGCSLLLLEAELEAFLGAGYREAWAPEPVRDICLSGNGEPTDSPRLAEVLALCARFRRSHPDILAASSLVLITNSTGFLKPEIRALLERYSRDEGLVVWAKLDAGGEDAFRRMSGLGSGLAKAEFGLDAIVEGLLLFARSSPVVIQTMLCQVAGRGPSDAEVADCASLLSRLVAGGARIAEVHLYTFARPSPGGRCSALGEEELRRRADFVRGASGLRVRAFGAASELLW